MKKKLLAILLAACAAIVCAFGLAACGESGGNKKPSEGLEYTLNGDGESYYVSGIGTCTDTDIVIPNVYEGKPVTSIGTRAFWGCSDLTGITIPDSVTYIGQLAFYDCSGLTSITIPNSVTYIDSGAFYNCSGLTSITLPNIATSLISKSSFDGCDGIIQEENGVQYVDKWVIGCDESVTEVTLRSTTKVIAAYAFHDCNELTSITIPNSVASIGIWAFHSCSGLTSITIPDSVTSIGDYAFSGCSGLTSITIPDSVTHIGSFAFMFCSGIIQEENGVRYVDKWVISCDKSVTEVTLRSNTKGIVAADDPSSSYDAFINCKELTSIIIPDSVTSIGARAFSGCSRLTTITIGNGVTYIDSVAFYNCSSLTTITFNGTMAQWQAIEKGDWWNDETGDFTVICTDGKLDKDGNEITV